MGCGCGGKKKIIDQKKLDTIKKYQQMVKGQNTEKNADNNNTKQ